MNHEATQRVISIARALIESIDEAPGATAAGDWGKSLIRGARELERAIERHYDSQRPSELRLIPAWIMSASTPGSASGEACWGRLGDTRAAFVTDGHAVLIVDDCTAAPREPTARFPDRLTAERVLERIFTFGKTGTRVSIGRERLEVTTDLLRIGGVALDARRVDRWVLAAACIVDERLDVTHGGPLDNVLFHGTGWRTVLAPKRNDDDPDRPAPTCTDVPAGEAA